MRFSTLLLYHISPSFFSSLHKNRPLTSALSAACTTSLLVVMIFCGKIINEVLIIYRRSVLLRTLSFLSHAKALFTADIYRLVFIFYILSEI